MKAELTESKLRKVISAYLDETPGVICANGLIWTSPEQVRILHVGLVQALTEAIFELIAPHLEYNLLDKVGANAASNAEVRVKVK